MNTKVNDKSIYSEQHYYMCMDMWMLKVVFHCQMSRK